MKPPLAIFSPLPPAKTGTADYCYEQLAYLAADWDLTVVVEKNAGHTDPVPDGVAVANIKQWTKDRGRDAATPRLYHVGNNLHHEYVVNECLRRPGAVMLHDFVLHHLIVEMTLARGNQTRYSEFMEHDFGQVGRDIAEQRSKCVFSDYQQFLMPLNGKVVKSSLGMIVHSRWAQRRLRHAHPQVPVCCIPHHYSPPDASTLAENRAAARRAMGMPEDKLIFMAIGFVTPPKRVDLTIRALSKIRDRLPPFEFWLIGECRDPVGLKRELAARSMEDVTHLTGYVPLERFQLAIQASDVIVNLRYPTAGESSGTLVRALGMGRPAVVFDYASFADVPSEIAEKIPLETRSTDTLQAALLRLGTDETLRRSMGERAARYIRSEYALPRCASAYTAFLRGVLSMDQQAEPLASASPR